LAFVATEVAAVSGGCSENEMDDIKRSKTIGEFCFAQRFSKSFYYELKRRGLNPDELEVLGVKRITAAAEEAWLARMAEHAKSEAAQFEAERRRKLATIAGRSRRNHLCM
jgi:hypothetical protein